MFAVLGDILIDVLPWSSEDGRESANYAEHPVVEGKPRLQWMGDGLAEMNARLRFHALFTDPERELNALRGAMRDHRVLALTFANGEYQGDFVIEEISRTVEKRDGAGNLEIVELSLKLKEWAADPALGAAPSAPAAPRKTG